MSDPKLTIMELREIKRRAEKEILGIIHNFEVNSGTTVEGIDLTHIQNFTGEYSIFDIRLEVKL